MIAKRDRDDQERTLAPLQKADDALVIDTTFLDIDEVCTKMLEVVQAKRTWICVSRKDKNNKKGPILFLVSALFLSRREKIIQ